MKKTSLAIRLFGGFIVEEYFVACYRIQGRPWQVQGPMQDLGAGSL